MPAATTAPAFVIVLVMVVVMAMFMVVAAVPMIVPAFVIMFVLRALPAGQQDKEKSHCQHKSENDKRIHNRPDFRLGRTHCRAHSRELAGSAGVPPASSEIKRQPQPASETLAFPECQHRFSGVTAPTTSAIVSR